LNNPFENRIARRFRDKGYYTVVSAGSRGIADVVAIKANEILFIQCKRNRGLFPAEKQKLKEIASNFNARAYFATHKKGRVLIQEI